MHFKLPRPGKNNALVGLSKTIDNDNKNKDDIEDAEEAEAEADGGRAKSLPLKVELVAFFNAVSTQYLLSSLSINISLSLLPSPPRLAITFGSAQDDGKLLTVKGLHIAIGLNGAISVVAKKGEVSEQSTEEKERANKVLKISESLGVLVAWIDGAGKEATRASFQDIYSDD